MNGSLVHLAKLMALAGALCPLASCGGCASTSLGIPPPSLVPDTIPRELSKTVLPEYTVEPPDILWIEAVHITSRSPCLLKAFDVVSLHVQRSTSASLHFEDVVSVTVLNTLPDAPIDSVYSIDQAGMIDFGAPYGVVHVDGLGIEEASKAIDRHLRATLRNPVVYVSLAHASQPFQGAFTVQPGGMINLGVQYGSVCVSGLTVEQTSEKIREHLSQYFPDIRISVSLLQVDGQQPISGEHVVGPDGSVTLGSYGSVPVVGKTLSEAKVAIEAHLAQYIENPEVSVSVYAYNSKVYYVITQGAGMGDGVSRFPVTGNETVLDAVSQINGLEPFSSKKIWIARPCPGSSECQILEVDWTGVTAMAQTQTNYQILPGDRVFVAEDKLVAMDTAVSKLLSPVERVMGFSILGAGTATRFSGNVLRGGGNPRGL